MADTTTQVLARLLDEPGLVAAVQSLAPTDLDALVRTVGLEDSGELLALATNEQFVHLIDESLWEGAGIEEGFSHERFVTWLEVMSEGGDAAVATRLQALPEETLVLAYSGQLFVLDVETLGIGMAGASSHEAELAEKALDACLYLELGDYTLVARRSTGWDVVIASLLALDQRDHDLVERILDECCRATTQYVEDEGGLYEVLTAEEGLLEDARADRNDRRARQGFVSRSDAEAFLRSSDAPAPAAPDDTASIAAPERDPIAAAYLRDMERAPSSAPSPWADRLRAQGILPDPSRVLGSAGHSTLRAALAALPADVAAQRQAELAFVANALIASDRGYSPLDAASEALHRVALGLDQLVQAGADPDTTLHQTGCDQLFRLGMQTSSH